jgi:uncharacterized protein (TIGR03435 family)
MAPMTFSAGKRFFRIAVVLAVVGLPVNGFGQTSAESAKPAFDVASIRRNVAGTGSCGPDQMQPTPNGFRMTNCPLAIALLVAYSPASGVDFGLAMNDRIVGMPDWVMRDRYDIDARISEGDVERWKDPTLQKEMLRGMLQSLLTERCKLAAHREMKDKAVYALVVGKKGSKLKAAESTDVEAIRGKHPNAVPVPGGGGMFSPGQARGSVELYAAPLSTLALLLSKTAGRTVVDKTGLTGKYDMSVDLLQQGTSAPGAEGDAGPSIFTVVQEQLGLRLEPAKDSVEILVVDHVERPTEN